MIHKFLTILSVLVIFLSSLTLAQFSSDRHVLGPSVGFSFLGSTIQFGLNHEYGINLSDIGIEKPGKLGLGGIFRYWNYSENFTNVKWSYSDILLGIQSNYHFYMSNDNIDPWCGIVLAYDFGSSDSNIKTAGYITKEVNHGGIWLGANAGMRYWFINSTALSIRIGFGTLGYGALDLGIDYKFE